MYTSPVIPGSSCKLIHFGNIFRTPFEVEAMTIMPDQLPFHILLTSVVGVAQQ